MQDNSFKYTDTISLEARTSHALLFSLVEKDATVLEFGCGVGTFAALLRDKLGCTVTGVELSPEAAEMAKDRLSRVFCLDAEDTAWEEAIAGESFDTVVVSDLLEHLKDPVAFLRRLSPFLSENGKILFSVPNIAHVDILAALSDERFDYTEKGLLDNTHLRFFAEKNLPSFFEAAGFCLTYLDATVCEAGATEQRTTNVSAATLRLLSESPSAFAYQFVGIAHKKSFAERMGLSLRSNLPPSADGSVMRALLDMGAGFDGDAVLLPSPTPKEETVLLLPENARRLRLFVRREYGYLILSPRFLLGGKEVSPSDAYGVLPFGDGLLLTESGAYLDFEISHKEGSFCFGGEISPVASDAVWQSTLQTADALAALQAEASQYTDACEKEKRTVAEQKKRIAALERELSETTEQVKALLVQITDSKSHLSQTRQDYHIVTTSQSWRATKPIRATLDAIKRILRKIPLLVKLKKGIKYLFQNGLRLTWRKLRERAKAKKAAKRELYTKEALRRQRKHVFPENHLFSILVPLYNTPLGFLEEMINSVTGQTYAHFELCLADGSDDAHAAVGKYCMHRAEQDKRIKYRKLEKNGGISENTNACIEMATGDYIALFDHDDLLHPAALYEMMRAIEKTGADFLYTDENTFSSTPKNAYAPHHKPDFAPDTLRSYNYICHFSCFSRALLDEVGGFRKEFDGSQDYDIILRLTEKAKKVVHIPIILYYWRAHSASVASDISAKPYTLAAARRALTEHLARVGLSGKVEDARIPSTYRIRYEVKNDPLVSIIIPNMDHADVLSRCIDSIEGLSTYQSYEILIVENNSKQSATFDYYKAVTEKYPNVRILYYEGGFNYSRINNFAVKEAKGEHLLFLNNDIEIISPSWLEEMLMFSQRKDVGAVGAMLYYPDDSVQHAGVVLGIGGVAGHAHKYFKRGDYGYMSRLCISQNFSAVTAACLMMRTEVFREVNGFDETLAVAFNDVDLCCKIRSHGYLITWTPYAEAYHHESKSRGLEDTPEKIARFNREIDRFQEKWQSVLDAGDPYYNPNLTLIHENFSLR